MLVFKLNLDQQSHKQRKCICRGSACLGQPVQLLCLIHLAPLSWPSAWSLYWLIQVIHGDIVPKILCIHSGQYVMHAPCSLQHKGINHSYFFECGRSTTALCRCSGPLSSGSHTVKYLFVVKCRRWTTASCRCFGLPSWFTLLKISLLSLHIFPLFWVWDKYHCAM